MRQSSPSLLFALIAAIAFALSTAILALTDFGNSSRLNQLRTENQQLQQRTEILRTALARFNEDQDEVSVVIEELETELAEVRRNYARLGETAEDARRRLESATERLDRLSRLEQETQRLSRENRELEERNRVLVDRLETSRDEVERLREAVSRVTEPADAAVELF